MPSVLARALAASVASATVAGGVCALQAHAHDVTAAARTQARTSPSTTAASPSITLAHDSADRALSTPPTPAPTPSATPAPSPAPAPSSSPQSYSAPAAAVAVHAAPPPAPKPPPPPPAPVVRYNWLRSDNGSVNTGVGYYTDCSGQAPVPRGYADIDTCMREVTYYFVGHHPGVFNGLVNMPVGAGITYWDGGGHAHHYVIVARRVIRSADGPPSPIGAVEFQTCVDPQGVQDYILDANPG